MLQKVLESSFNYIGFSLTSNVSILEVGLKSNISKADAKFWEKKLEREGIVEGIAQTSRGRNDRVCRYRNSPSWIVGGELEVTDRDAWETIKCFQGDRFWHRDSIEDCSQSG